MIENGGPAFIIDVDPDIVDVAVIRPEPGRIKIYPLMKSGLPSEELKAAVATYLDPETRRPMGDDVSVKSPEPVGFDMVLTVRTLSAIAGVKAMVEAKARAAFSAWTRELGSQIAPSVIIAAVKSIPGVSDVSLTGFDFIDLAEHQFARLDTVTVNLVVKPNG